jgi:hypothetical protein
MDLKAMATVHIGKGMEKNFVVSVDVPCKLSGTKPVPAFHITETCTVLMLP